MTDSLIIKDGAGSTKSLTVKSGSYGYIPVHAISSSAGSGSYVTASANYPVYVTGNVSISQPVNVDVVVGDNIAVTSSLAAPLYVSSSANSPLLVTGTLTVNTASSVSISNSSLNVTASFAPVTSVSQASVTSFVWNTSASGTFQLAANDTSRKGLTLFNPGPHNLFIALSSTGGTLNGFTLVNTASAPSYFSLILYPSGTYVADSTNVGVHYGGYFISGSASSGAYITKIS